MTRWLCPLMLLLLTALEDVARMHGNDERVSIESLGQGVQFLRRAVVEFGATH